jgi:hypothetical protein
MAEQLQLWGADGAWHVVSRCDPRARILADRHYSRQTVGAPQFMANGRPPVMLTSDGAAVWGAIENLDPAGQRRWRCALFRNEAPERHLSSELVREATRRTRLYWRQRYGCVPPVPLQTEVHPGRTRRKRDPGRCFRRAGWTVVGESRGLIVLEAPADEVCE